MLALVTDHDSLQWLGCMGVTVGKVMSLSGAIFDIPINFFN